MKHIAVVGACYIDCGIAEFNEWSEVMLRDFGPSIEPILAELHERAREIAAMLARMKGAD